jgi:hypothetical protein
MELSLFGKSDANVLGARAESNLFELCRVTTDIKVLKTFVEFCQCVEFCISARSAKFPVTTYARKTEFRERKLKHAITEWRSHKFFGSFLKAKKNKKKRKRQKKEKHCE